MKKTVKVTCEFEVPYNSYGNRTKDRKAESRIRNWIKSHCRGYGNDLIRFIPLYVEKDVGGAWIEDVAGMTKVKFYASPLRRSRASLKRTRASK